MPDCVTILSVEFAPAVLEPEDVIPTAPISTDYKEKDNKINFIVVDSHVYI